MNQTPPIVTISSATIFKAILIGLLFWLVYFFRDLVLVVLTAVVIASAIEPITKWCMRYRIPRVIAVILTYLLCASFLFSIFYIFIPPLLNETLALVTLLPHYVENFKLDVFFGDEFTSKDFSEKLFVKDAIVELKKTLFGVSGSVFHSISTVFGGFLSFVLIIVLSFYLAVQEKGIEKFLRLVTSVRHERYIIGLWERSQKKIGLWMQGQLLLGVLVGVLVYLGLTILGVQYALLLAVLSAMFELIPLFGPILAAIPAVVLGFIDSATLGFMVLGLYIIIQQFENHLIYPLVVRKVVGVSPIIVILGLVIGAKLAGFLGVILAVPIAAALMEFADDIQKEKNTLTEKNRT